MINLLTKSIEKQKSRRCFDPIFDAETAKVVIIPSIAIFGLRLRMTKSNAIIFVSQGVELITANLCHRR